MDCPACGASSAADARFCASCGQALKGGDDERRVVTVLFADLVGFTTMSERLDPERVKILVDRCFERLAAEITAFGGRVDKIVGDAIVALFGAPIAHEDDAERAVRAALRLHEVVRAEAGDSGQDLRLRIGINTGEVLVGAMRAAGSITAMGDVVNTASRLQTAAEPGQVLVGPATHVASNRAISYRSLGPIEIRGRVGAVEAWEAVAPIAAPGARQRRDDLDLVGRDHELALLEHAVRTSFAHDRALLVLLVADVGMGKSRLADEVARWSVEEHRATTAEGRCLPYGEANVWWPVADAIRGSLGVDEGAPDEVARASIAAAVDQAWPEAVDGTSTADERARVTSGLMNLLGFEEADIGFDAAAVREETSRALAVYLDAVARRRPVVLQVSDLHWGDDALLELIDDVMASVAHGPVVFMATARPDLLYRWQPKPGRHNAVVLHLDPLDRPSAARLLRALADRPLEDEVVEEVLDRSGGNPFFLQELVPLLDAGDRVPALPDTLRGLVVARLDGLEPGPRALLQDASVVGQRGSMRALHELAEGRRRDGGAAAVATRLATLVEEGLLDVDGSRWSFRSDLVREVAYETITKADRAKTHHDIAAALEEAFGDHRPQPSWLADQLAHHYGAAVTLGTELDALGRRPGLPADLPSKALRWTLSAAAGARRDQAMHSALARYDRAVVLSAIDPVSSELDLAEVHVLRADAAVEAWDLDAAAESVDAIDELLPPGESALRAAGLAVRGRLEQRLGSVDRAVELLGDAEAMYGRLDRVAERAVTLRHLTLVLIFAGRLDEAERIAERARVGFSAVEDVDGEGWVAHHLAWIAFVQGDTTAAQARLAEARSLFETARDARGRSWSLGLLAWINFQSHQVAEAAELAGEVLEEARSRRDPWATPMMTLLIASIRLWDGETDEAVRLAAEAHRAFLALGDPFGLGLAVGTLGRSLVMAGRIDEGDEVLAGHDGTGPGVIDVIVAAQLGDLARLEGADGRLTVPPMADARVAAALVDLQRGDVDAAGAVLAPFSASMVDGPARLAATALWCSAAGRDGAVAIANELAEDLTSTYLDRVMAHLAAALRATVTGDLETVDHHLGRSAAILEPTGDRVTRHLHRLVAVAIDDRIGADGPSSTRRPDPDWELPGLDSVGWRRVVELALDPVPVDG